MDEWGSIPDYGLGWLDASGPTPDVILSTRVRLARNLQGYAFGARARVNDRTAVLDATSSVLQSLETFGSANVVDIPAVSTRMRRILLERRLASRELIGGAEGEDPLPGSAVALSTALPFSVMVNEEDHLRLQCLRSGLQLKDAWSRIDTLDDEIGQHLPLAYHPQFGYLTSCPTNVGTGLRASVFMHLPGLVLTKEIGKVLKGLSQVGLTFRGLYGEGSDVVGNFFQVSNQTTLGKSEEDLIEHLDTVIRRVVQHEAQARKVLLRDAALVTEDKIWRAYGLLRYSRSLSFEEMMSLLSAIRLGVSLKLLPAIRVYTLNKIMIFGQDAHLEEVAGRELSPGEHDVHRAAYVRAALEDGSTGPGDDDPAAPDRESR